MKGNVKFEISLLPDIYTSYFCDRQDAFALKVFRLLLAIYFFCECEANENGQSSVLHKGPRVIHVIAYNIVRKLFSGRMNFDL